MIAHVAYVVICFVAWIWAVSQLRYALRAGLEWPVSWRVTVAIWLLTKAAFLTYVGWVTWDGMTASPHVWVIVAVAIVHVWTFARWLRLPDMADPDPPGDPALLASPRTMKWRWFVG